MYLDTAGEKESLAEKTEFSKKDTFLYTIYTRGDLAPDNDIKMQQCSEQMCVLDTLYFTWFA